MTTQKTHQEALPKPVSPNDVMDVTDPSLLTRETVDKINFVLSRPWTGAERMHGRNIDAALVDALQREALIAYFHQANWIVTYQSDQREGTWFNFKKGAYK